MGCNLTQALHLFLVLLSNLEQSIFNSFEKCPGVPTKALESLISYYQTLSLKLTPYLTLTLTQTLLAILGMYDSLPPVHGAN